MPSLAGSVVLMDPEPRKSVKEVEEGALRAWLRSFGAQAMRLRLSGHYLPHQFRNVVEALRPKDLIPVHTEGPTSWSGSSRGSRFRAMSRLAERL